jgi:hypothetical protein
MTRDEPTQKARSPSRASDQIVVFKIRRESKCAECGDEMGPGRFLRLENERPLCMRCADLDHLEFLPRGDAALTRRATKYSPLHAVVVRWSKTRKQYERQGILVTADAIEKAEQECLADEDRRARQRQRAAERRQGEDQQYIAAFAEALLGFFPGCPPKEAAAIAGHACQKHSGRVGRSGAAKEFDAEAIRLAVVARIRHEHTKYDELLMQHGDRAAAREAVRGEIERVLVLWQKR